MSLVTKLASAIIQQEMDAIVKNSYFKLSANNITLSTLKEFSLEKIKSNIKADAPFFHSLIREASDVKKVNAERTKKIVSFDIVRGKTKEERTIPLTNSVPKRT